VSATSPSGARALLRRLRRGLAHAWSGRPPQPQDRLETRASDAAAIRAMEEARMRRNGWNINGGG
jgi:hypothetical protein